MFLQIINRHNVLGDIYRENKWKYNFKNPNKRYDWIFQMHKNKKIWEKIKIKLLKLFPNFIEFYNIFDKNSKKIGNNFTNFVDNNIKSMNFINILHYIDTLFLAYNSKEYYKIYGFTKTKKNNFIPEPDIEFFILNISNYKKLINYFLKKLKKRSKSLTILNS